MKRILSYTIVLLVFLLATACDQVGPIAQYLLETPTPVKAAKPTKTPKATRTPASSSPTEPSAAAGTPSGSEPGGVAAELPDMPVKPQPQEITFKGCPAEGDGGDPALNRLKNRVDEGDYVPVSFDAVFGLTWPAGVENRDRDQWSKADTATIAKDEGIPVSVEGYLAMARESGPESCNCHGSDPQFRDWHIWLTKTAGEDRTRSIIVETTPRVRANHPGWTLDLLQTIIQKRERVRISGWLFLDPEHPDQVDKTRGTIWEIHPVMKIEVQRSGTWVTLDSISGK